MFKRYLKRFIQTFSYCIVLLLVTPYFCQGTEITKELLVGGTWFHKNYYYTFKSNGKYIKEMRPRGKKAVFHCKGKYKIEGNILYCKAKCPSEKEKIHFTITKMSKHSFTADKRTFGRRFPKKGSVTKQIVFEKLDDDDEDW